MSWLTDTTQLIGDSLIRGGPLMIPLTIVSILVWSLIIERLLTLRKTAGNWDSQVFMEPGRFLPAIGILATVAPLLGLLGTVAGMVKTFEAIALHGTGDPEPLAKGIAQALITTQTGLIIAIPALLCHTHLIKKVDGIIETLRRRGAEVSSSLWRREEEMESHTTVRSRSRKKPEINIAPLVDMVFLLLIFFMVTTTFSRETGVRVERPVAKTAQALAQKNILIAVTREGTIHMHEQEVDLKTLRMKVTELISERPERAVILLADKDSKTGLVIKVMDQCRLAGAKDLAIASLRQRE